MKTNQSYELKLPIQSILDSICLGLTRKSTAARLTKAWVYQDRVAVFDYNIKGHAIAFDVTTNSIGGGVRVEVLSRTNSARTPIEMLELDSTENGHFLVAEIKESDGSAELGRQASLVILNAVDRIAALCTPPGDDRLIDCIGPISPLVVVDVGANELSEPPYAQLRYAGLCKVVGFEPQQDAFDELQRNKRDDETYFPFAIGTPGEVDLNIYKFSGFTSTYKIDEGTIGFIVPEWFLATRLQQTVRMNCLALDDVPALPKFDMLKIDVQGGELNVFRNARRVLASALCVITEVSFFPLYENAPSFADVHQELLAQGFFLHKFLHQIHVTVGNSYNTDAAMAAGSNQMIDGDAIYMRDYRNMDSMTSLDIKKLALISHFIADSKDLTLRMLSELVRRNELSGKLLDEYISQAL